MMQRLRDTASSTWSWLANTWVGKQVGKCRDAVANSWIGTQLGKCKDAVVNSWIVTSISSALSGLSRRVFGEVKPAEVTPTSPVDPELDAAKQDAAVKAAEEAKALEEVEAAKAKLAAAEAIEKEALKAKQEAEAKEKELEAERNAQPGDLDANTETVAGLIGVPTTASNDGPPSSSTPTRASRWSMPSFNTMRLRVTGRSRGTTGAAANTTPPPPANVVG